MIFEMKNVVLYLLGASLWIVVTLSNLFICAIAVVIAFPLLIISRVIESKNRVHVPHIDFTSETTNSSYWFFHGGKGKLNEYIHSEDCDIGYIYKYRSEIARYHHLTEEFIIKYKDILSIDDLISNTQLDIPYKKLFKLYRIFAIDGWLRLYVNRVLS